MDTGGQMCGVERLMRGRERVIRRLQAAFPRAAPDLAESAFADTALELHETNGHPNAMTAPWSLVYVRCWRRLRVLVRSERSRQDRETRWAIEQRREVSPPDAEAEASAARAADLVARIRTRLLDDRMRITFDFWWEGERDTEVYAEALGITSLPVAERRRAVKRERDRLRVYLRRTPAIQEVVKEPIVS